MIDFIEGQKIASICCVDENHSPYCFSCFYAYDKEKTLIYFKTSAKSHHALVFIQNPVVAGTIQPDKLSLLAIKGVQFTGTIVNTNNNLCPEADEVYYKKYPFARAMPGEVYTIQPDIIKMTDNTLGFGKKITWQRNELEKMETT
jgi:uncharacterized protein